MPSRRSGCSPVSPGSRQSLRVSVAWSASWPCFFYSLFLVFGLYLFLWVSVRRRELVLVIAKWIELISDTWMPVWQKHYTWQVVEVRSGHNGGRVWREARASSSMKCLLAMHAEEPGRRRCPMNSYLRASSKGTCWQAFRRIAVTARREHFRYHADDEVFMGDWGPYTVEPIHGLRNSCRLFSKVAHL